MKVFIHLVHLTLILSSAVGARNNNRKLTQNVSPKKTFGSCKAETGATTADIDSIKARTIPKTKTGRCYLECIFNKAKILDEGKFDKNGMLIAFTPALKGDLTKMGKLKELSEVCEKEIGLKKQENCEGSKKVIECIAKYGDSYGLSFSNSQKNVI